MEEAQLVVNRLFEKEPKTRQEIQLIKLEVGNFPVFHLITNFLQELMQRKNLN